jgi:hypothetical protein
VLSGVDGSWPAELRDINTEYRLQVRVPSSVPPGHRRKTRFVLPWQAESDVPLIRASRPRYRSIPSRRDGDGKTSKFDYYIYATRTRGFVEWLVDR